MVFSGVLLAFYFSQLGESRRERVEDENLLELLAAECREIPGFLQTKIDELDSAEARFRTILKPADSVLIDSVNAIMIDVIIPPSVWVRSEEPIILIKPQIDQRFVEDLDLREALEWYYTYNLASEEVRGRELALIDTELRPYFEANYQYFGRVTLDSEYHRTPEFRNHMLHLVRFTAIRKEIFRELQSRAITLDSIVSARLQ